MLWKQLINERTHATWRAERYTICAQLHAEQSNRVSYLLFYNAKSFSTENTQSIGCWDNAADAKQAAEEHALLYA